jgi:hypothetical protein
MVIVESEKLQCRCLVGMVTTGAVEKGLCLMVDLDRG